MRIFLHGFPHQLTAIIFDHRDDRPLIDAEVIWVAPAAFEGWIERIGEAVLPVNARVMLHRCDCRDRDVRREGDRRRRRGRRDRSVIADIASRCSAAPVGMVGAAVDGHVARAVARREPPHVAAVILPASGIVIGVRALRQRRAPRILEIVDAFPAHVRVLNPAEVDEHLRVLMTEQRSEKHVLLPVKRAPLIRPGVFGPGSGVDRMRRRA